MKTHDVTTIGIIRKLVKEIRSETSFSGRADIADRIFLMLDKAERELLSTDERDFLTAHTPRD